MNPQGLKKEYDRVAKQLQEVRAKLEVEKFELDKIIERKVKLQKGKEIDEKADKPALTAQKNKELNNQLRALQIELERVKTETKNISGRKKKFEEENKDLEERNKKLQEINTKLLSERVKIATEVDGSKAKLQREYAAADLNISGKLDEIDRLAKKLERQTAEIEKERENLKSEYHKFKNKVADLDDENVNVINLQAKLNASIDKAEKEKAAAIECQTNLNRSIAELKHEENRIEILRLRVLKTINDNKQIKELEALRKELLK